MKIGIVIHKWRVASEIEQKTLAREIGISESTLCRIEKGKGCDARALAAMISWLIRDKGKLS